jgi:dual specificity phosphatase 12
MSSTTSPATEILPGLFIGNRHTIIGKDGWLKANQISVVISALSDEEYDEYMIGPSDFSHKNITWHQFTISDDEMEVVTPYFDMTHLIVKKALSEGKRVLIHCSAGVSRSATLIASYLIFERGLSSQDAINYISRHRNHYCNPNPGFRHQLKTLASLCRDNRT